MTTDAMREKFETEVTKYPLQLDINGYGDYVSIVTHNAWMAYQAAYAQGQRDLIEAMGNPSGYSVPEILNIDRFTRTNLPSHLIHAFNGRCTRHAVTFSDRLTPVVDKDGKEHYVKPLYALPEGFEK